MLIHRPVLYSREIWFEVRIKNLRQLSLSGTHPAAIWLAIWLQHRGYPLQWKPSQADFQPSWSAFYADFYPDFGELKPEWPLEWCWQELHGLAEYPPCPVSAEQLTPHLQQINAALLDLSTVWQEAQSEWRTRNQPSDSVMPPRTAGSELELEISWADTSPKEPQAWEQVGQIKNLFLPGGMLTVYREPDEAQLYLAPLSPGQAAYTYFSPQKPEVQNFQALLSQIWSEYHIQAESFAPRPAELDWPRLQQHGTRLVLSAPRPSLFPRNMLMQGVHWLLVQSMGRWLTEGFLHLEDLGSRSTALLEKIQTGLSSPRRAHKFLRIPD